jgi:DNA-binding transcriptional ArsR family regulator
VLISLNFRSSCGLTPLARLFGVKLPCRALTRKKPASRLRSGKGHYVTASSSDSSDRSVGHVLVSPDKFKGSLSAPEVATHVAVGLRKVRPEVPVLVLPVADGGDGTAAAAIAAGFRRIEVEVRGPIGRPVAATLAVNGTTAVVELAEASGLSAPAMSKHLRVLLQAGVVVDERPPEHGGDANNGERGRRDLNT